MGRVAVFQSLGRSVAFERVQLHRSVTIHTLRRVIRETSLRCDPHVDGIRHIDRKWRNTLIESDNATIKRGRGRLQPAQRLRWACSRRLLHAVWRFAPGDKRPQLADHPARRSFKEARDKGVHGRSPRGGQQPCGEPGSKTHMREIALLDRAGVIEKNTLPEAGHRLSFP